MRFAWCLLLFGAFFAAAHEPYIGYVYPSGVRAGTRKVLVIGGQGLDKLDDVLISGKGVAVRSFYKVPNFPFPEGTQRKYLLNALRRFAHGEAELPLLPAKSIRESWRKCEWYDNVEFLDEFDRALLARYLLFRPNALQDAPSLRQLLIVEVDVAPDAPPGERTIRLLHARRGLSAPRPFFVDAVPHCGRAFYTPPFAVPRADAVCEIPCVLDGAILPGATERFRIRLEKGVACEFAVAARHLQPFIGDAVPGHFQAVLRLLDSCGREVAYADDHGVDPDPLLRFAAAHTGVYTLEIRDNLYRGREDFVYRIDCRAAAEPRHAEQSRLEAPLRVRFHGKKGERFFAACFARREFASPLDGVLRLYTSSGALLAENDDRKVDFHAGEIVSENDPELTVCLEADDVYTLELSDRCGRYGADRFYRLEYGPPRPDFRVYGAPSALNIPQGGRGKLRFFVERRGGFDGAVRIFSEDLVLDGTIPPGKSEVILEAGTRRKRMDSAVPVAVFASAPEVAGGGRRAVAAADRYLQAFAYDHLLPARDGFRLFVLPPRAAAKKQ